MTTKEKVKLILVVDASGSMGCTQVETVTAVEKLIQEHRDLDNKKVTLQIYTFDDAVREIVPNTKLKNYTGSFSDLYSVGGMTALFDAIVTAVDANKENTKFSKTSLIILTDGAENSSRTAKLADVSERLTYVQDTLGWNVVYLGAQRADFDKYTQSLGIAKGNTVAFDPNQHGTRSVSLQSATTFSSSYFNDTSL